MKRIQPRQFNKAAFLLLCLTGASAAQANDLQTLQGDLALAQHGVATSNWRSDACRSIAADLVDISDHQLENFANTDPVGASNRIAMGVKMATHSLTIGHCTASNGVVLARYLERRAGQLCGADLSYAPGKPYKTLRVCQPLPTQGEGQ